MFNRSPFPMSFNRPSIENYVDLSVEMTATTTVYSKYKESFRTLFNQTGFNRTSILLNQVFDYQADMTLHADISGVGTISTWYERGIPFDAHMSGAATFDARYIRERLFKADMHGMADMYANFNRYTIKKLSYTGDVLPGDMIVIDMDRMTVTNNTHNALKYFEGDFFELAPSHNELIYSDKEQSRNVVLVTRYKDRWL